MRAEVGASGGKAEERSGKAEERRKNERVFGSEARDVRAEAEERSGKAGGTCAGVQKNRSHMRGTVRAVGYGAHSAGEGRKLSKGIVQGMTKRWVSVVTLLDTRTT